MTTADKLTRLKTDFDDVYDAGYEKGKAEGGDGYDWVDDTSEVVYEKECYQNRNISLYVTENSTGRYEINDPDATSYVTPTWAYSNYGQMSTYHTQNTPKVIGIKQAEIVADERITAIGRSAFAYMKNLKVVKIPQNITALGNSVFQNCENLKTVSLSDSVSSLGEYCFINCYKLENFKIPASTTSLGGHTFSNCTSLKTIEGIEQLTSIGVNCFYGCVELSGVLVFNENLDSLGGSNFASCFGLTEVRFLGTPTSINSSVFNYCVNITDIYVPWAEGEVANAPWNAVNATIHYNTTYDENHNPIV